MSHTREDVLEATRNLTGETIPVHVELTSKQVILAQPEMRELLSDAELIAVGNCACREKERNCDNPLEVCLALGEEGHTKIRDQGWRRIEIDQAMELLAETHRRGLVHMAYRRAFPEDPAPREISFVCSCCTCCCWPLNGLRRVDYHDAITESAHAARFDAAACVACGVCADRCPFGAFALPEGAGTAMFDESRCFGCGLCVSTCPNGAISFVPR
jgi:Pyruvate/2-oxoacid:ferredoxin oxidoreductase delta subunit